MKSTKFNSLALMTNNISKTKDMMDKLLVIRVNYKKQLSIQKSLFVKYIVLTSSLFKTIQVY